MHVVVIGAGINGLLTAWYLRRDGHDVTVLERHDGPGRGASYANGAQLSYSYVAPLAGPSVLAKTPRWLLARDAPLRLRPAVDWRQWRWLLAFAAACTAAQSERTMRILLPLAFYSRRLMRQFVGSSPGGSVQFGHATNGKLVVYSDAASFAGARRLVAYQSTLGCEQDVLTADDCRTIEPALADPASALGRRIVGGVHTPSEEVGDCYRFCLGLERLLRERGVAFAYGFGVQRMRRVAGRVAAAIGTCGEIAGDAFILAGGADSARLGGRLGLYLPIYPLKGYSLTMPAGDTAPAISITDFARKVVYAPLDAGGQTRLRVAGLADLVGRTTAIDPHRVEVLAREVQAAFPGAGGHAADLQPWAGLRPATPSGIPLVGPTRLANLYLNCGHGALGWTLAHATARIVTDVVGGRPPEVSLDGLALT